MADSPRTPAGPALSRAALERVLARAARLQGATGEGDDAGSMTEAQIVELGKEVGLSADALRGALAEELKPYAGTGRIGRDREACRRVRREYRPNGARRCGRGARGARRVDAAQRGTRGEASLCGPAGMGSAARFLSAFRRALTISRKRKLELAAANDVTAIVAEVSPGQSHARIVADFRGTRNSRVTKGLGLSLLFALLVAAPLVSIGMAPLLAATGAALAVSITLFVTRSKYNHLIARAQVALEQALDRLEFASDKPATTAQVLLDAIIGPARPPR